MLYSITSTHTYTSTVYPLTGILGQPKYLALALTDSVRQPQPETYFKLLNLPLAVNGT